MSLIRKRLFAVGGTACAALTLAACGSGVPGDAVAVVAGNPITKQAFDHWLFVAAKGQSASSPGSPVIVPDPPDYKSCIASARTLPTLAKTPEKTLKNDCQQVFGQLRDQVMDFLVRSYWYQAESHAKGIKITDQEVNQAFQTAKQAQFPTATRYNAFLTSSGQTQADILYRVRVNEIYKKLIAKQATSTSPATIAAYYRSHTSQFGTPEKRNLRIVLTKTAGDAKAAMTALAHGGTWKATAARYSTDPATKSKGGLLTNVAKGQEDVALDAAAFSAQAQTLSGPVKGQFGYYVFKVTNVTAGTQQSLAQATPLIKQILTQQGQTAAQTTVDALTKKAYQSKTTCRSIYQMADCQGFKAKTATTPGAAGTATPQGSAGTANPAPSSGSTGAGATSTTTTTK